MLRKFNITIVSPSDVKKERLLTKEVCQELNTQLRAHNIRIIPHLWEDYPASYQLDRQECFNIYHDISKSDLVVAILWKRVGTVLSHGYKGEVTNKDKVTGTQYELETAIKYNKILWIYLKQDTKLIDIDLANIETLEQNKKLKEYLKELEIGFGNAKHGYHDFYEKEFKLMFKTHLIAEIARVYEIELEYDTDFDKTQNTKNNKLDPGYYAGLYGFLTISAVILFFYNINYIQSPEIKLIIYIFAWSLIFVNIPAIKSLPTYTIQNSLGFKTVYLVLLRRAAFMLFFTMLLTTVLYLVVISLRFKV